MAKNFWPPPAQPMHYFACVAHIGSMSNELVTLKCFVYKIANKILCLTFKIFGLPHNLFLISINFRGHCGFHKYVGGIKHFHKIVKCITLCIRHKDKVRNSPIASMVVNN